MLGKLIYWGELEISLGREVRDNDEPGNVFGAVHDVCTETLIFEDGFADTAEGSGASELKKRFHRTIQTATVLFWRVCVK